jgi:flagellar assembly factor FliW
MNENNLTMPSPASSASSHLTSDVGEEISFTTKFGEVKLRTDRLIDFPHGLFGFQECTQFGFTKLPNVEESPIMLMQCVNQPSITFLVADPSTLGLTIAEEDKAEALSDTQLPKSDTQFLSILTLYESGNSYYLTANLRAPLLIDSQARTGLQYILTNKSYTTQHKI